MSTPFIEQILIGKPQSFGQKDANRPMDREWESAIVKQPVKGAVYASKTNIQGDGQADLVNHGGTEKAIFAYPAVHYDYWQKELELKNFTIGAFGENFAIGSINEWDLSIGDIFQAGEAIIQVSQPRQPCWKPARRWKVKDLALRVQNTGKTGWYFRVLKEGNVQAGDSLILQERPYPEWTIAKCNDIMHFQKDNMELSARLAKCELLAPSWQNTLQKRVNGEASDIRKRVIGPNE